MTNYTLDSAVADLAVILEGATKEASHGGRIAPMYLADGFSLIERYGLRVHAVLMSQGDLDVLLSDHAEMLNEEDAARGVGARIWSADIFCPLMTNDVIYFVARRDDDEDSVEPAMWSQLNLDGIEEEPHSVYDKNGRREA